MTSPDGINWTIKKSATDNGWLAITYGNKLFVAVAISGSDNRIMTANIIQPILTNFTLPTSTIGDLPFNITQPSSNSSGLLIYSSSNTNIATISDNTITIKNIGSTIITATQFATSDYSSSIITAILRVKIDPIIGTFDITNKSLSDSPYTIIGPIKPNDHTSIWSYSSSNTDKAIINGNIITFISSGIVKITATLLEDSKYSLKTLQTQFSIAELSSVVSDFKFTNTQEVTNIIPQNIIAVNNTVTLPAKLFTPESIQKLNPISGTNNEKSINRSLVVQSLFQKFTNITNINVPKEIIYLPPQIDAESLNGVKLINSNKTTSDAPTVILTNNLDKLKALYCSLDDLGNAIEFIGSESFSGFKIKIIKGINDQYSIIETDNQDNLKQYNLTKGALIYYAGLKLILGSVIGQLIIDYNLENTIISKKSKTNELVSEITAFVYLTKSFTAKKFNIGALANSILLNQT